MKTKEGWFLGWIGFRVINLFLSEISEFDIVFFYKFINIRTIFSGQLSCLADIAFG
jgi:hypothetical protein